MTTATLDKPQRRRRSSPAKRQQNIAAYVMILPFLVFFIGLFLMPLVYAGYLSVFVDRLVGGMSFAGLDNYVRALTDERFIAGIGRIALFFVIQVPAMLAIALFFALALDSGRVRGTRALRLLVFVPYAVPGVIAAMMWGFLYGNNFGPISQTFRALGLQPPDLLGSPVAALFSIANIVSWGFIGYNMIVMYSALRSIPGELYEAAEIDGAGQMRIAWSIKIPAIRPAIMLTMIFSVIGSFQLFNEPNLLRGLAPDVLTASFTPNMYAYNLAFVNQEFNYAAAVSVILGIVIMIVSFTVQLGGRRREDLR